MSSLKALQEEMKHLVFYQAKERETSFLWKDKVPERLNVYRGNTRLNWADALEHDFPLTRQQFVEDAWDTLKRRYFIKHPPEHWELNTALVPFTKYLAHQDVPAFVKELADYEWADLQIFIHRAPVEKGLGVTNPTLLVRVFQHQIFDWVQAGAPKARPPRQKPEVLVFFRDSQNTCHIQEADPLMLLMVDHFRKPGNSWESLETACQTLLPKNKAPLKAVLSTLRESEIIL